MGYAFIHDWTTEGDPRPMAGFGIVKTIRPGDVQRSADARQSGAAKRARRPQQGEIGQPESGEWDAHGGGGASENKASQKSGHEKEGAQMEMLVELKERYRSGDDKGAAMAMAVEKESYQVGGGSDPRAGYSEGARAGASGGGSVRPAGSRSDGRFGRGGGSAKNPGASALGPQDHLVPGGGGSVVAPPVYGDNPRLIGTYRGKDPAGPSGSGLERHRGARFPQARVAPDSTGQGGGLVPGSSYPGDTTGQGGGVTYGPPTTETGGGVVQNTDPSALIGGGAGPTPSYPGGGGSGFAVPGVPGKHFSPDSFGPRAFERPYMGSGRPPAWPGPWDREGGTTVTVVQAQQQAAVQAELADHAQAIEGGMPPALANMAARDNLIQRGGLSPAEADQLVAQAAAAEQKTISPWILAALAAGAVGVVYHLSKKKNKRGSGQR